MHTENGKGNGAGNGKSGGSAPSSHSSEVRAWRAATPPPSVIADLADGCVRHVERSLGVKLDFEPETLPVLDHYIALAREEARSKPEVLSVLAHTTGAYLGEVVRRRYPSWWRTDGDDPSEWQIEFESVYLAFSPVRLILEAVLRVGASPDPKEPAERLFTDSETEGQGEGGDEVAQLELEEDDHAAVAARLAELPPVSEEEFYAPSTRVEVIDIAVEAIRARRIAVGDDTDTKFSPDDYRHQE